MKKSSWHFPEINDFDFSDGNHTDTLINPELTKSCLEEKIQQVDTHLAELKLQRLNLATKEKQADLARRRFKKQSQVLSQVTKHLLNPLHVLDTKMLGFINELIKKITQKLILQAIAFNPQTFADMIQTLTTELPDAKDIIEIQVSSANFLNLRDSGLSALLTENGDLTEGDIIVKTQFGEVQALLSTRLDHLLGIELS
jgi:flagellar biosynthesis/type III secretory pathway protein FliH